MKTTTFHRLIVMLGALMIHSAASAVVYLPGESPTATTPPMTFGDHQVGGGHASVNGTGGGSGISNNGDTLNAQRTYIWDKGGQNAINAGVTSRGDNDFAMLIWDMGSAFNSMRLYTHQDHYSGGPVTAGSVAQDLMEYSVWGSHDGDDFVLLSDVIGFDIDGGGVGLGLPTYTFTGTEPTVVYRGGSAENHVVNAYTRDYVFGTAFQWYGVRTSSVSIDWNDADPEIDAIAGFHTPVPEPATLLLMGFGLAGLGLGARRRKNV